MIKWVTTTTSATTTINFVLTSLIIAALAQTTNGFRPIEVNSGEGRKLFGGYRITPKHCRATKTLPVSDPRANGPTICMFNHECAQRNGEVVGACMDGFLFGACCQIPHTHELESTLINDAQNTYYQQHQQQKLQLQQTISNPAAAQSYETYGENSQQQHSQEHQHQQQQQQQQQEASSNYHSPQPDIYEQENINKVYQQLDTSNSNYGQPQVASSNSVYQQQQQSGSSTTNNAADEVVNSSNYQSTADSDQQQPQQPSHHQLSNNPENQQQSSSQQSDQNVSSTSIDTQSASIELENDSHLHAQIDESNTNEISDIIPPTFHVQKDSVKISSPSSPPHNDDFVMQVLSTLSPDQENDHITFTTEVPMKIASNLADQASSESNSFEEEPSVTQVPQQPVQHANTQTMSAPQNDQQQTHSHHHNHNHLMLDGVQFTHSDITHPGADADLVEDDLQFSTGYGPQPVYVESPNKEPAGSSYGPSTTIKAPSAEDKYVLVQTITNEQQNKKPSTNNNPTTLSSITTHVDSIESIILQLNNTNHGPSYNVVSQQTPSYGFETTNSANSNNYEQPSNYYVSTPSPATSTVEPLMAAPTNLPASYYEEIDTKRPEYAYLQDDQQGQQKYPAAQDQVPAYLEPVTTNLNLNAQHEVVYDSSSDDKEEPVNNYMQNEYSPTRPATTEASSATAGYSDDSSSVLDEHTMPENSYNDVAPNGHQTSEFNKMPAVGIAYPVDMSYVDEEGSVALDVDEQLGYGDHVSIATSQKPIQSKPTITYQKVPDHTEPQTIPTYTRVPTVGENNYHSVASYIGMVTSQNYNQQKPTASVYSQVPEEVSVSSYTTKIQEEHESSSPYQHLQSEKFTTINYVESEPTTVRPIKIPTTSRPLLVTASSTKPKHKPKPTTKNPSKRPTSHNTSKQPKPQGSKKPAQPTNSYNQEPSPAAPTNNYNQHFDAVPAPSNNYDQQPQPLAHTNHNNLNQVGHKKPVAQSDKIAEQPTNSYGAEPVTHHKKPAAKPSQTHNHETTYIQKPVGESALNYNQEEYAQKPVAPIQTQPSNFYQQGATYNKKPAAQPASTYNAQPVKTKKPVTQSTLAYQQEYSENQPISTYDQNIKTPAQQSSTFSQGQHSVSSPTKRPVTRKPVNKKPANSNVSTSYVTGPTSPRPPTTYGYHDDEVPPLIIADDKLDSFVHITAAAAAAAGATPSPGSYQSTYQAPAYVSSVTPVHVQRPQNNYNTHKKPGFVKVQPTVRPPVPTVLITPKPTVINLVTSSLYAQRPNSVSHTIDSAYPPTTPIPGFGSTSYLYNPSGTRRPDGQAEITPEYVNVPSISSNDFDDSGYHGIQNSVHPAFTQSTTEATFGIPSDDRPAFPGYYGPTPTYPAFQVPDEKVGAPLEEETYTSPNDFNNFPPVRNPNLNMSATSSAVTSDLELSTPAFVEDIVLKDKMNSLVHKIVESLQGNFEALADMIDETNNTAPVSSYQAGTLQSTAGTTTVTRKPTRKPTRVTKPKATTKKPITRISTKAPTKKPTVTTRKPVSRRTTTTTTRKPVTRKPTKRTTTTGAPLEDEIVDEEDEEDVNPSDNEIDQGETISTAGAGGRKFQCGVRPHVKTGRIVGGKGATFGAYPWQVLVRESTWLGLFTKNKCGGVLITSRYVITAAHCQPGFLASLVAVMGEFDISGDLESKRSVTKNVKRVIVHRQYDPATFENDLALLELESTVQFDTHIVPICMPTDQADFTGRMATVTGWGRLKYGGGVPSVLQEVQVPVIENSVCQEMFHTAGHNKKILGSFLCAGYANGQKDSCEGDSGGPLVLQRPDGRYELAGTVSHGIKCAAPYLPGVYMRTTFYKPWLRSITGVK